MPDHHGPGHVRRPHDDERVTDAERFIDDRRRECLAMVKLWEGSRAADAAEQLAWWKAELARIDRQAREAG